VCSIYWRDDIDIAQEATVDQALKERSTESAVQELPLEHLEHEICQLSAHLAAAMCRWLVLVAELDRRKGWAGDGVRSCAHWLNWRCGLSMAAAHEHVRVARRLGELAVVRAAFAEGRLSYSKARALTRIATPATEADLVALAAHATAAHLDRIARARRSQCRPTRPTRPTRPKRPTPATRPATCTGSGTRTAPLVLTARLAPEEGALVLQALEAAAHALRSQAPGANTDSSAEDSGSKSGDVQTEEANGARDSSAGDSSAEDSVASAADSPPSRHVVRQANAAAERRPANRADALVAMAETMLAHGPAARDGGERYQAVVLVDADVLDSAGEGRCHIEDGPALAAETATRMTCDAAVVAMSLRNGGEPLNVGRSTQAIPPAIRRALRVRDGGCRFPGCTQRRFVDGHHIVHWARGGETSLSNLCLLCRFHHRAVHEGGYGLRRSAGGTLVFTTPTGDVIPPAPEHDRPVVLDVEAVNRHLGVVITSQTGACLWGGERLDLGLAVDALLCLEQDG